MEKMVLNVYFDWLIKGSFTKHWSNLLYKFLVLEVTTILKLSKRKGWYFESLIYEASIKDLRKDWWEIVPRSRSSTRILNEFYPIGMR